MSTELKKIEMNKIDTKDLALGIIYENLFNIDLSSVSDIISHSEEQKLKNIIKNHRKKLISDMNDLEILNHSSLNDKINYIKKEKYERY